MPRLPGSGVVGSAPLDALHATSRGTGELIRIAVDAGARRVVVGVGGSACTDGGAGLLQALGARLTDSRGAEIGPGGAGLGALAAIDLSPAMRVLSGCSIEVACDIRGPLLGPHGAARMFAPQKGARPEDVQRLERALARFAALASTADAGDLAAVPGAGAAGGCGFGLALLGARLTSGAALVCDLVGLDASIRGAAAVITGEGRLDQQTPEGKAPAEVAARALRCGIPCIAIAGTVRGSVAGPVRRGAVARDHGAQGGPEATPESTPAPRRAPGRRRPQLESEPSLEPPTDGEGPSSGSRPGLTQCRPAGDIRAPRTRRIQGDRAR